MISHYLNTPLLPRILKDGVCVIADEVCASILKEFSIWIIGFIIKPFKHSHTPVSDLHTELATVSTPNRLYVKCLFRMELTFHNKW